MSAKLTKASRLSLRVPQKKRASSFRGLVNFLAFLLSLHSAVLRSDNMDIGIDKRIISNGRTQIFALWRFRFDLKLILDRGV